MLEIGDVAVRLTIYRHGSVNAVARFQEGELRSTGRQRVRELLRELGRSHIEWAYPEGCGRACDGTTVVIGNKLSRTSYARDAVNALPRALRDVDAFIRRVQQALLECRRLPELDPVAQCQPVSPS